MDFVYLGEALIKVRGKLARVLGDQIRSVDKSRLRGKLAVLNSDEMAEVERAIGITLGLPPV